MKRAFKWLVSFLVGLLVLGGGGVWFYDWSALAGRIQEQLVGMARANGVGLRLSRLVLQPVGISAESAEVFVRGRVPLSLTIDRPEVWASLTLSPLQLVARETARLYKGDMRVSVRRPLFGGDLFVDGALDEVELQRHPQVRILGFVSGILQATGEGLLWTRGVPQAGRVSIAFDRLEKPQATRLPLHALGLPIESPIPAVRNGRGRVVAQFEPDRVLLSPIESDSSIWRVRGEGALGVGADRQVQTLQLELRLDLLGEGVETLGPWLVLASEGKLPEMTSSVIVRVTGRASAPRIQISPAAG